MDKLKVMFIDNRVEEVSCQWDNSGVNDTFDLIPIETIGHNVYNLLVVAEEENPDVIVIGFDLGRFDRALQNGADVIKQLRGSYGQGYKGFIIANSGGGARLFSQEGVSVDASADRTAEGLKNALSAIRKQLDLYDNSVALTSNNAQELLESKPMNFERLERKIIGLLNSNEITEELEILLEAFLGSRQNIAPLHHYWVHALSHFSSRLWELRMTNWIARLNEAAIKGAIELSDYTCSERFVLDFGSKALWNDNPGDYYLTLSNLEWMDWSNDWYTFAKSRIEVGSFPSEQAYIDWKTQWCNEHPTNPKTKELENKLRG